MYVFKKVGVLVPQYHLDQKVHNLTWVMIIGNDASGHRDLRANPFLKKGSLIWS